MGRTYDVHRWAPGSETEVFSSLSGVKDRDSGRESAVVIFKFKSDFICTGLPLEIDRKALASCHSDFAWRIQNAKVNGFIDFSSPQK